MTRPPRAARPRRRSAPGRPRGLRQRRLSSVGASSTRPLPATLSPDRVRRAPAPTPAAVRIAPSRTDAPSPTSAPPCPVRAARTTERTVSVGGVTRTYLRRPPTRAAGYRSHRLPRIPAERPAAGLVYRPLGGRPARGFVVLTPDGYQGRRNFVRRAAVGPDDVAFAEAARRAATQACLDGHRITATGMSDGADMADTLACALPGRLAAVAPGAPSVFPLTGCQAPVSYLEIHGSADPIVPYSGGGGDRPPPFQGTEAQPVTTRLQRWQQLDRCPPAASVRRSPHATVLDSSCPAGHDVELLTIDGGGHTWPDAGRAAARRWPGRDLQRAERRPGDPRLRRRAPVVTADTAARVPHWERERRARASSCSGPPGPSAPRPSTSSPQPRPLPGGRAGGRRRAGSTCSRGRPLELGVEVVAVARASAAQDLQLAFYAEAQRRGFGAATPAARRSSPGRTPPPSSPPGRATSCSTA